MSDTEYNPFIKRPSLPPVDLGPVPEVAAELQNENPVDVVRSGPDPALTMEELKELEPAEPDDDDHDPVVKELQKAVDALKVSGRVTPVPVPCANARCERQMFSTQQVLFDIYCSKECILRQMYGGT